MSETARKDLSVHVTSFRFSFCGLKKMDINRQWNKNAIQMYIFPKFNEAAKNPKTVTREPNII